VIKNANYILFSILRSALNGNQMGESDKALVTQEILPDLINTAKKHDIAHLIALGLLNNKLVNDDTKALAQKIVFKAVYRFEKLNYELERVCQALELARIPFITLKGSVIRKYYPEPWMRTSCDIDILVHKEDLKTAVSYLVDNLNFTEHRQNSHDVSLYSQNGVHIELHYDLVEDGLVNLSSNVLVNVWDTAAVVDGSNYRYNMTDDMFYFYHIAHMAKHFKSGGCGIRPFIDLWILDNIDNVDTAKRNSLLKKGELLQFANAAQKLSRAWFDNQPLDAVTEKMQNYIICGGVYGSKENRIAIQQQKRGGKIKFALSRIFLSYNDIKFYYPVLQKHRWLTPFMQVCRWFNILFGGNAKRSIDELTYSQNISKTQADEIKAFLYTIGL